MQKNNKNSLNTIWGMLWIRLMLFLCLSATSWAQSLGDIEAAKRQAETIQRQEQERVLRDQEEARRHSKRVEGVDTKTFEPSISVPNIGVSCREIKEIVIKEAPNLSDKMRQEIQSEFTNRCLKVSDIEAILGRITKDYIDRGFVTTRAYLPTQDLSQGRLEILVVEGRIEKIMIEDEGKKSISVGNVFPLAQGELFNLRDFEQGIDQINRLVSNNARLDIAPGSQAGFSQIIVRNQPKSPWHFNVAWDDQGSKATGKNQVGLTMGVDNLFGKNDFLSITHREALPQNRDWKYSRSENLFWSVPFGYATLSGGASFSEYVSKLQTPGGLDLQSRGSNTAYNVKLDYVSYRDKDTRLSFSGTLTTKSGKNYLDNQFLGVSSRQLTILDVDSELSTAGLGGAITLNLGWAQGLSWLGALKDLSDIPDWAAHAQFSKFKFGLNYMRPFRLWGEDFTWTTQLTGQLGVDTLYGSEQISIGGIYSVRGFVNNSLSGDRGYYVRNDLAVRRSFSVGDTAMSGRLYLGYDFGEVTNIPDNIAQGKMSGMAVGMSLNWKGVSFELFNTRPLSLPSFMVKEGSQTWMRVSYAL